MGYNWGMVKKILIVFFSLLLIGAACFYNAVNVNPTQFKIREETIISDKIDEDLDGFLVAYFTDLSLNDKITDTYVDEVFAAISSFKPEMIVFGGDLLDQDASIPSERIDHLVEKLSDLHYNEIGVQNQHREINSFRWTSTGNAAHFQRHRRPVADRNFHHI